MSKYRQAARIDKSQNEIVKKLRSIPGVTVEVGHDDILIGRNGLNYWVELKTPEKVLKKSGELKAGALKDSQIKLQSEWCGQYLVAWDISQILAEIGLNETLGKK